MVQSRIRTIASLAISVMVLSQAKGSDATICGTNQYVNIGGTCSNCAAGSTRDAGDDTINGNTACDATLCDADERVSTNACVACDAGSTNDAGDPATGVDTTCEATLCGADERVSTNACVACDAGSTNDAGDPATGVDTTCEATLCGNNERVSANACTSCLSGYINGAGDPATGGDTQCDDLDECATNNDNCDSDATCTNSVGSFSCSCNSGFSGDGETCTRDLTDTAGCDGIWNLITDNKLRLCTIAPSTDAVWTDCSSSYLQFDSICAQ